MPELQEIELDLTKALIDELKESLENGNEIDNVFFKKVSLIIALDTHTEVKTINGRLKKVEAVTVELNKHPSILRLLHTNTKRTVAFIMSLLILVFLALEIAWEYGLFPRFVEWFGWPPLMP
jgi:uncharacterized protein YjaG (DUF416 family)